MATLKAFAAKMKKVGVNVSRNGPLIQRKTAAAVLSAVVVATPVDTGRARSNWLSGLGGARTDTVETAGKQGDVPAQTEVLSGSKPGQDIHITNNLPYIVPLNEGHSAQAPAGFVEAAIQAGTEAVQGSKILGDKAP